MLLVLDASVVAKWFKEEIGTENALEIGDQFYAGIHDIVIPDLLLYEITNVFRYDKKFDEELVVEAVNSLNDMQISIVTPSSEFLGILFRVYFLASELSVK